MPLLNLFRCHDKAKVAAMPDTSAVPAGQEAPQRDDLDNPSSAKVKQAWVEIHNIHHDPLRFPRNHSQPASQPQSPEEAAVLAAWKTTYSIPSAPDNQERPKQLGHRKPAFRLG